MLFTLYAFDQVSSEGLSRGHCNVKGKLSYQGIILKFFRKFTFGHQTTNNNNSYLRLNELSYVSLFEPNNFKIFLEILIVGGKFLLQVHMRKIERNSLIKFIKLNFLIKILKPLFAQFRVKFAISYWHFDEFLTVKHG